MTRDGCTNCGSRGLWNYQYDAAGRLFGILDNAVNTGWMYFLYDHDSNRLTHVNITPAQYLVTYSTYNPDDSIATAFHDFEDQDHANGPMPSTYTASGVLALDGCVNHSVDAFDRMKVLQAQAGATTDLCGTAPTATTYYYDGLGREVVSYGSATTVIHDGALSQIPLDEQTNGTDSTYWMDNQGHLIGYGNAARWNYSTEDSNGSVATITDTNATVTALEQYDPYGIGLPIVGNAGDVLYHGMREDLPSGTYQMGSRTYDPTKDSFLQPDGYQAGSAMADLSLLTDPATRNAYGYVNADPLNLPDPDGHDAWWLDEPGGAGGPASGSGNPQYDPYADRAIYSQFVSAGSPRGWRPPARGADQAGGASAAGIAEPIFAPTGMDIGNFGGAAASGGTVTAAQFTMAASYDANPYTGMYSILDGLPSGNNLARIAEAAAGSGVNQTSYGTDPAVTSTLRSYYTPPAAPCDGFVSCVGYSLVNHPVRTMAVATAALALAAAGPLGWSADATSVLTLTAAGASGVQSALDYSDPTASGGTVLLDAMAAIPAISVAGTVFRAADTTAGASSLSLVR